LRPTAQLPMPSWFAAIKRLVGKAPKEHAAEVLNLRNVVVASSVDEVYLVKRKLGEGMTASVYEGVCLADGKTYALKAFKLDGGLQQSCEGLRDEVTILRAVPDHPGIVQMKEIISTPGCVYLAMELVAGGDLLSPIEERGAYNEQKAMRLFAQMTDAISELHKAGIVHRDLKPENVCFTDKSRNRLKIIDMGAAGFLTEAGLGDLCGTPLYAAPEVTPWFFADPRGPPPPRYDERVDLWSMGVALYVMLSGAAPFDQEQPVEMLMREICRGRLGMSSPDWKHISSPAKSVVSKLLATDPNLRMPMAELREHPWIAEHMRVLANERESLAAKQAAAAEAAVAAAAEDPLMLKFLSYLSRCIVRSAVLGRESDGVVLLLSSGGGGGGGSSSSNSNQPTVNPSYTIHVENGIATVSPGKHLELPLALIACTRVHLLKWLEGKEPLVPHLPEQASLASFLSCFDPDAAGFALYCRENGLPHSGKAGSARPRPSAPPPALIGSSADVTLGMRPPPTGIGARPPPPERGLGTAASDSGVPGRPAALHHVVPRSVAPPPGMGPGPRPPPPGNGARPPPPGMGARPPPPPPGMGPGQRPAPPGSGARPPPPGMGIPPPMQPRSPQMSPPPRSPPPGNGAWPPPPAMGARPLPPGMGAQPPPRFPPQHQPPPPPSMGMRAGPPRPMLPPPPSMHSPPPPPSVRPPPPGAHQRSLSSGGGGGGVGGQRALPALGAPGVPTLGLGGMRPPPPPEFEPEFDLSPRAQQMAANNEVQAL